MLLVDLIYNIALLGINVVLCMVLFRRPTLITFVAVLLASLAISLFIGIVIGVHGFRMLRLTCWGWLLQAPLLCLAMAIVGARVKACNVMAIGIAVGIVGLAIAIDSALLEPEWLEVTEYEMTSHRVSNGSNDRNCCRSSN